MTLKVWKLSDDALHALLNTDISEELDERICDELDRREVARIEEWYAGPS